jgi:hypothetical protein
MSILDDLAGDVAVEYSNMSGDRQAAFDPSVIFTFLDIIMELFQRMQECRQTPENALETVGNPGVFQKAVLRSVVRQRLGNGRLFNVDRHAVNAFLKRGKSLNLNQVKELYQSV